MGIIHKLKPEVLNFILENKQKDPALSCRNLTELILEKLQIKVSKSSINAIFKEHNLSMPIGRRQKHKKKKFNMPTLPVIEGIKAVTVVPAPELGAVSKPVILTPTPSSEMTPESKTTLPQKAEPEIKKEEVIPEQKKEDMSPQDKRVKEAEEWAMKLQEEERARIEEKLSPEKQKVENEDLKKRVEETEVRALLEEAARVKTKEEKRQRQQEEAKKNEEESISREATEKRRLEEEAKRIAEEKAAQEAAQNKKLEDERITQEVKLRAEKERLAKLAEEEAKKIDEERLTQEAELKAEKEKWAKLAEEEHKVKQENVEEVVLAKEGLSSASPLIQEQDSSGVILLKALDCLIGGSKQISEAICKEAGGLPEDNLSLTQAVIFRSLFDKDNMRAFWNIVGKEYTTEQLDIYYAQLKQLKNIKLEIFKIISSIFTEARGVKIHFIDGNVIHLDGQLHTSWPTQNIPFDFSSSVYELKNNLNMYFCKSKPLVLFSAPGYDIAPKDFFNLLINIGSTDKYPDTLTLFGNKLEELEKIPLDNKNIYSFVFGLWPWQFTSSRKVKKIGEFSPRRIKGIDKDFFLANIEIDLLHMATNQTVSLKGCAIKTNLAEKIRLVVLGSSKEPIGLEELAGIYLNRWPNLDEAFHDFSRKTELFAYVTNAQKFFSKESCGIDIDMKAPTLELEAIFTKYVEILDAYLRWHFLPSGYIDNNFSFTSVNFYKMPVKLISGKDKIIAKMQAGQGYQFAKDLEYLTCRLNERQINLENGLRLYFESAFK